MFKRKPPQKDKCSLRKNVVNVLSMTLLLCIIGSIFLAIQDKTIPEIVQNLGTSASAALVGLLIPPDEDG